MLTSTWYIVSISNVSVLCTNHALFSLTVFYDDYLDFLAHSCSGGFWSTLGPPDNDMDTIGGNRWAQGVGVVEPSLCGRTVDTLLGCQTWQTPSKCIVAGYLQSERHTPAC